MKPEKKKWVQPPIKVDFWWADKERLRQFREDLMDDVIGRHGGSPYTLADDLRHHPVAGQKVTWNQEAIYRLTRLGLPQRKKERVYSGVWTKDLENAIASIAPFIRRRPGVIGHTMESLRAFLCGASETEIEQIYQATKNTDIPLDGTTPIGDTVSPNQIRGEVMPSVTGVREFARALADAINRSGASIRTVATCCRLSMARIKELCEASTESEGPTDKEIMAIYLCEKITLLKRTGDAYELDELLLLVYPAIDDTCLKRLKINA